MEFPMSKEYNSVLELYSFNTGNSQLTAAEFGLTLA